MEGAGVENMISCTEAAQIVMFQMKRMGFFFFSPMTLCRTYCLIDVDVEHRYSQLPIHTLLWCAWLSPPDKWLVGEVQGERCQRPSAPWCCNNLSTCRGLDEERNLQWNQKIPNQYYWDSLKGSLKDLNFYIVKSVALRNLKINPSSDLHSDTVNIQVVIYTRFGKRFSFPRTEVTVTLLHRAIILGKTAKRKKLQCCTFRS